MGLREKAKKLRNEFMRNDDEEPLISNYDIENIEAGKFDEVIKGSSLREKAKEIKEKTYSESSQSLSNENKEDIKNKEKTPITDRLLGSVKLETHSTEKLKGRISNG